MPGPSSVPNQALLGPFGPSDGADLLVLWPYGPISPSSLIPCLLLLSLPVPWLCHPDPVLELVLLLLLPAPLFLVFLLLLLLLLISVLLLHPLLHLCPVQQQEGGLILLPGIQGPNR